MITVAQATEKIIYRSRYLSEAISKGIINTSALARYIRPEVEQMLVKEVSDAAILMAINRLAIHIKPKFDSHAILKDAPEMILRSQLFFFVYKKTATIFEKLSHLLENTPSFFLSSIQSNTIFVCNKDFADKMTKVLKKESLLTKRSGVSAITILLPKEVLHTAGIYYFFLKSLAWEGINIIELISVENELTLVLEDKDAQNAYTILQSLFQK